MSAAATIDRAYEVSGADDAVAQLLDAAGGDRGVLESARDEVARRLHRQVDDFAATGALRVLNRALSEMPRVDPLDWRIRWTQRFRKP